MTRTSDFCRTVRCSTHLRWVLVLVLLLLVAGLSAWTLLARVRDHRAAAGRSAPARVVRTSTPPVDHGPLPAEVAENFIHATTQAERLKWVRSPGRVATLMEEFFRNGQGAHEVVSKLIPLASVADPDAAVRFGARLAEGGQRLVCVVRQNGEAKVDFEAYTRQGTVSWEDLLGGKARQAAVMRVFIQSGNYYNYDFTREEVWQNFTATLPDREIPLRFYMARKHPDGNRLKQVLDSQRATPVTVEIRALGESHLKRQFEITKVLAVGWVLGDEPTQ